ncbi:uncharacterized protein LOC143610765 [Bidens hawaiensis]|uniref:uncharacterized protein LOC143610765 n=1 Tax=Bidens hawaiensis TaxID=980011 RepID=UPI00404AC41D
MPQESLRSVVYRSFVTCEDPRGVAEGKIIRISKTGLKKMRSRNPEKETHSKSLKDKEKMSLLEVKNGTQKLNQTIDSWSKSKGVSLKSQPKDIAKDLLKGALDLQESLIVLGKLQEGSCMPYSKKKQEKESEDNYSGFGSDRFESFTLYDSGCQKDRKFANGSSRDCLTELREVIKEGLSKQNLLPPNKCFQETVFTSQDSEALAGKKKLQLSSDIASTSSSISSSMMYSTHEFTSSESFSSRTTEEKSKGSNLIAKLMGLEEFPSKPPRKQLDVSSKTRPVLDFDLPNAKKPSFFVQKSDRKHMSLDEIIIMMQYKGVLRSNKQEVKQTSKRFMDDASPIVLVRPQRLGPDHHQVKVYDNPMRKLHKEKAKTEDISVKNKGNNKQKASVSVVKKPQRKQEVEKKIDKIQKMAPPVKKKPVDNAKSTSLVSKNGSLKQVNPQRSVQLNPNKLRNQMKNIKTEKPVKDALTNPEETRDSEATIKATKKARHQSPNKAKTRNNQQQNSASYANEQKARILKTITDFQDSEPANSELFHDCINEFLEHENQRCNFSSRVFICSISEDQLIKDIIKKLETLNNYSKFSMQSYDADTVSVMLERDLSFTTCGTWGTTGWKDGCTVNEIEETVLDLEKLVLSRLIDEMLLELVSKKSRFV